MATLLHAKVSAEDDGQALLTGLDDAIDRMDVAIRDGNGWEAANRARDTVAARSAVLSRIWELSEALAEARQELDGAGDRANELQEKVEEQDSELQARHALIVQLQDENERLHAQLREVQHA